VSIHTSRPRDLAL